MIRATKLDGTKVGVNKRTTYSKTFGVGIFKTTYTVERYEMDDGTTHIVIPTKLLEFDAVKEKLNELLSQLKVTEKVMKF